jgi:glycerol-3-phosphate acyltransferase PlsX
VEKSLRIAIDAMGSDFAPVSEIAGAIQAAAELNNRAAVEFVFVGDETLIAAELAKHPNADIRYTICHASQVITMKDEPAAALRAKKDSSIVRGIELHRNGDADAFLSAGNTGAVMSGGTLILGRIRGVTRPTIASFFPTVRSQPTLVVDVGANVDCKPRFLYEFGVMGSIYVREVLGISNPRVALLNVGEEDSKGNTLVLEAHRMMRDSKEVHFVGNTEGRDILMGSVDVVVCDGFTGNIVLKFAESFVTLLRTKLKDFAARSLFNKISVALMVPTLRRVLKEFDYQEYGGVPLLGVNGVVIIGHGKSSPLAIKNMILRAVEVIDKNVNRRIEEALQNINESEPS